MNKIIVVSIFILLSIGKGNSQNIEFDDSGSIEILLDKRVNGFGPKCHTSIMIATKDRIKSIERSAYPKVKNIPDSLTNLIEYCFHLNTFQFFYQNYKNDIFSKDYFIAEAQKQGWPLKDTIFLSELPIKNTISVAAGETSEGIRMYVVDANNNDDFSDDTLRTLLPSFLDEDVTLNNSYPVEIEFFNGRSIIKDKQLLRIISDSGGKSLSFCFPQYRYGRFNYQGESYLVCSGYKLSQTIYLVLEDKPFLPLPKRDEDVEPFQLVKLGDDYFRYIPISQDIDKIVLNKIDDSKLQGEQDVKLLKSKTTKSIPTSSQVGMNAPNIEGLSILDNSMVSLEAQKGKYVFIDFWSTYCIPCISEFPNLKTVYEKYNRDQFEIIGVVDDRTKGSIQTFLKDKDVSWPNISKKVSTTNIAGYMVTSYPSTFLINPQGRIIATDLRGDALLNKLESLIDEE